MEFTVGLTTIMVYISCLCFSQDLVLCNDYAESGTDITFTPRIRGKPEKILWRHNDDKVLEYDGSEVLKYGPFEERVDVDFETGQLTIKKLKSQDRGQYQSEILINGKVQTSSHTLTVLDPLPEPQVTCELDGTSNLKKLLCSVEFWTQPRFEWSGPNIKGHQGPELLVDEQEENRDSVYICTVNNDFTKKSTSFSLQDCSTGRATPDVLVPVIIITILLILLIILALLLYRYKKSKRPEQKKTDSEKGEQSSLLKNNPPEVISGSSDATLPSQTRLTSPKESIADKKWDQDNKSENTGETDEGQKPQKGIKRLQEKSLQQSLWSEDIKVIIKDRTNNEGEQISGAQQEKEDHGGTQRTNTDSPAEMKADLAEQERSSPQSDHSSQEQDKEKKQGNQNQEKQNVSEEGQQQKDILEHPKPEEMTKDEQTTGDIKEEEERRGKETPDTDSPAEMKADLAEQERSSPQSDHSSQEQDKEKKQGNQNQEKQNGNGHSSDK